MRSKPRQTPEGKSRPAGKRTAIAPPISRRSSGGPASTRRTSTSAPATGSPGASPAAAAPSETGALRFSLGDLVLCRYNTYPYWPATIDQTHQPGHNAAFRMPRRTRGGHRVMSYWCVFSAEDTGGWVRHDRIVRFHPALVESIRLSRADEMYEPQSAALVVAQKAFQAMPAPPRGVRAPGKLPIDFTADFVPDSDDNGMLESESDGDDPDNSQHGASDEPPAHAKDKATDKRKAKETPSKDAAKSATKDSAKDVAKDTAKGKTITLPSVVTPKPKLRKPRSSLASPKKKASDGDADAKDGKEHGRAKGTKRDDGDEADDEADRNDENDDDDDPMDLGTSDDDSASPTASPRRGAKHPAKQNVKDGDKGKGKDKSSKTAAAKKSETSVPSVGAKSPAFTKPVPAVMSAPAATPVPAAPAAKATASATGGKVPASVIAEAGASEGDGNSSVDDDDADDGGSTATTGKHDDGRKNPKRARAPTVKLRAGDSGVGGITGRSSCASTPARTGVKRRKGGTGSASGSDSASGSASGSGSGSVSAGSASRASPYRADARERDGELESERKRRRGDSGAAKNVEKNKDISKEGGAKEKMEVGGDLKVVKVKGEGDGTPKATIREDSKKPVKKTEGSEKKGAKEEILTRQEDEKLQASSDGHGKRDEGVAATKAKASSSQLVSGDRKGKLGGAALSRFSRRGEKCDQIRDKDVSMEDASEDAKGEADGKAKKMVHIDGEEVGDGMSDEVDGTSGSTGVIVTKSSGQLGADCEVAGIGVGGAHMSVVLPSAPENVSLRMPPPGKYCSVEVDAETLGKRMGELREQFESFKRAVKSAEVSRKRVAMEVSEMRRRFGSLCEWVVRGEKEAVQEEQKLAEILQELVKVRASVKDLRGHRAGTFVTGVGRTCKQIPAIWEACQTIVEAWKEHVLRQLDMQRKVDSAGSGEGKTEHNDGDKAAAKEEVQADSAGGAGAKEANAKKEATKVKPAAKNADDGEIKKVAEAKGDTKKDRNADGAEKDADGDAKMGDGGDVKLIARQDDKKKPGAGGVGKDTVASKEVGKPASVGKDAAGRADKPKADGDKKEGGGNKAAATAVVGAKQKAKGSSDKDAVVAGATQ